MQASPAGAVIILGMVLIFLICWLIAGRIRIISRSYNREKDRLIRRQIAYSLEESAPIHLDIGSSGDGSLSGGAMLSAADATETVSAQMAFADEPWMITASSGVASANEKDSVQTGMDAADYGNSFDSDCTAFSGVAPVSHFAGNSSALEAKPSALHLSIGAFGSISALADTMCSKGDILCVAGDDLLSQAVGTVTADAVYVGEQFTEIPDSLSRKEKKDPALLAMDVFRWVLIAAIAVFTVMGLRGI